MLYIFNLNEQLQAILKNDGAACPYSDAVHTEKLTGENTFTFSVPADHPDSQYATEGNLVAFKDPDANWQLFEIKRVTDIHGDGLTRTAYCEHALYELIDDFIEDRRPTDCSATFALTQALTGTRWQPGTVDDLGLNSTNYYYESALSAVQKVANTWKGELRFRVVVTGGSISARYVDLLTRRGADTGKQFAYSKDIESIEREADLTTVMTAAYGRGKGVEVGDGYGRRLSFADIVWTTPTNPADKPAGQEWVGDPGALAQWGRPGGRHRFGVFEDSEETDPAVLLQKTWDYLQENKNPRVTYKLDVADLERLTGYEHEKVRLGDTVRIIDRAFSPALLVSARVIEIGRNLLQPADTKITLGNFAPTLADDALKQQETLQVVRDRQGVWDTASPFVGPVPTSWLDGIINTLQNEVKAGNGSVTLTDNNGILIVDNPAAPTKALRLLGGLLAISNEKDTSGNWVWRTFGTGDGFTADQINAGQIRTSLVKIFGNSNFYWDGDYLYIVNPANLNEQIRLSKEGIRFTRDGGQTWSVAIGFDGIRMIGKSEDDSTEYAADGVRVNDASGILRAHLGHYETLADQIAAFSRSSIAYKSDGTQMASGVPRYEYASLPAPVWQDLFDTDQLATQYTSGGDAPATWAVSGGVLTGTGGSQATLLKKDLLLQDCEIVVNSDQADNGGIIARYQDNNNYYLLTISDDSSSSYGTQNLRLFKRVGGTFINLAITDVIWLRGTSKQIKFSCKGNLLEAYFDGAKVISVTDTAFTGGGVGLRNNSATAFRVLDFTVYYVQQGMMVEEGCTNIVASWPTGWSVSNPPNANLVATDMGVQPGAAGNTIRLTNSGTFEGYYNSPLFALSPSTTYTLRFKARGTVGSTAFDVYVLSNTGTLVQGQRTVFLITGAFQELSLTFTTTADITGTNQYIRFDHNGNDAGYIEIAEVTLIQKAYALSFPGYGATRSAEVLPVPTAGVFQKGNWSVKLRFTPTSNPTAINHVLWSMCLDPGTYNNLYELGVNPSGQLYLSTKSGGTQVFITDTTALTVVTSYSIMASGNGSVIRLCKNGTQVGSDTAYTEPAGTLPANMVVGYAQTTGANQANGIISDFAVMSKAQTLAEHQAEYSSGQPLSVTEYTTYLMSCNGTLQPTVRRFGLWSKNGEITLAAPPVEGGIRVYDASGNLRTHIGQYAAGKYGAKVINGEIYSTLFKTGDESATDYIKLAPGGAPLSVVKNNKTALEVWTFDTGGSIVFWDTAVNDIRGMITVYSDMLGDGLRLIGRSGSGGYNKDVIVEGNSIRLDAPAVFIGNGSAPGAIVWGDLHVTGGLNVSGLPKNAIEETSCGKVALAARESPDVRYIDEGKAQLINGECKIEIDPILLECIVPNSDQTPWLVHLTPTVAETLYITEIGDTYFVVKSTDTTSNATFYWSFSAIRRGFTDARFQKDRFVEEDVLTSNWEDELGVAIDEEPENGMG